LFRPVLFSLSNNIKSCPQLNVFFFPVIPTKLTFFPRHATLNKKLLQVIFFPVLFNSFTRFFTTSFTCFFTLYLLENEGTIFISIKYLTNILAFVICIHCAILLIGLEIFFSIKVHDNEEMKKLVIYTAFRHLSFFRYIFYFDPDAQDIWNTKLFLDYFLHAQTKNDSTQIQGD
jgi:hypothetical protein